MGQTKREFVDFVRAECEKHGVAFKLLPSKSVSQGDGCPCTGYFDEDSLVVAHHNKEWFETLVHEYCHMRQWLEKSPLWKTKEHPKFWAWVDGQVILTHRDITRSIREVRDCEFDCERRAVRLIKARGLPVDMDRYIRSANAYVLFYTFVGKTGVWNKRGHSACGKISVLRMMPGKFMPRRWYRHVPPAYAAEVFNSCLTPNNQRRALARLFAA